MAKFAEAAARLFKDKVVCKKCKSVVKAPNLKVLQGHVTCPKCKGDAFRSKRKK